MADSSSYCDSCGAINPVQAMNCMACKHSGAVYTLGWSPNGKYIASASKDGTAQVWNATN